MASSSFTCKDDVEDKLLELYGEESSKLAFDDDDSGGGTGGSGGGGDDDGEEQVAENAKQDDQFWESQKKLVEEFLCVRSLHELSLKRHVKNAVDSTKRESGRWCSTSCTNSTGGSGGNGGGCSGCGRCLREIVTNHLGRCGYRASICRSEWKADKSILNGSHEYIEVIIEAAACKKEIRYIIEVDFRSEFELAKSSNGYQQIVNQLPQVYVGKPDRLRMVLRAICEAMKRSLAEKKMYVGPWRKFGFMQMKWLGPSVRQVVSSASHMDRMKPEEMQRLNSQNYGSQAPLSRMVFFTTPLVKAMG